ncbi:MAG TPA: hypothetical protein VGG01_20865 [Xanthobacteraceae bacterium]
MLSEIDRFFEDLPPTVRDDLSFMMMALSDENLIIYDVQDLLDVAAQRLFSAQTPIGRLGSLINAVSVFDVYFAMDPHRRFASTPGGRKPGSGNGLASLLGAYADQIGAIEAARQQWAALRQTPLTPAAIAEALSPPAPKGQGRRRSLEPLDDRALSSGN